jgi:hypothetical protein
MKKKRITYGVNGMMEYQAIIKVGRATLKVMFSDGSLTAFGQNPAKYTTSDFLVQHAIENSSDFKRGRITVVNSIELDEDVRIERNTPKEADAESANTEAEERAGEEQDTASDVAAETSVTDEASVEDVPSSASAEGMTEVEFTTNQEAKDYLANRFGVKAAFRNRAEIVSCGETYGVKIIFANEK